MAFDPDAFLAEPGGVATATAPAFDPDAFLSEDAAFDPDQFLAEPESPPEPSRLPGAIKQAAGTALATVGSPIGAVLDVARGKAIGTTGRETVAGLAKNSAEAVAGVLHAVETDPVLRGLGVIPKDAAPAVSTQFMRDVAGRSEEAYGIEDGDKDFVSKIIGGATSIVPALASGPAAPAVMAGMMGESLRGEAEAAGGTKQQQNTAFNAGATVGVLSEALLGVPALLRSARKMGMDEAAKKTLVRQTVEQGLKSSGREGTQEAVEQLANNFIASDIARYEPNRPLMQGVGEAALIGAIVGGPVGATVQAAASADAAATAPPQPAPIKDKAFIALEKASDPSVPLADANAAVDEALADLLGDGAPTTPSPPVAPTPEQTAAAVNVEYQGVGTDDLLAFKDLQTNGNFSIKAGEFTPEKFQSELARVRASGIEPEIKGTDATTEDVDAAIRAALGLQPGDPIPGTVERDPSRTTDGGRLLSPEAIAKISDDQLADRLGAMRIFLEEKKTAGAEIIPAAVENARVLYNEARKRGLIDEPSPAIPVEDRSRAPTEPERPVTAPAAKAEGALGADPTIPAEAGTGGMSPGPGAADAAELPKATPRVLRDRMKEPGVDYATEPNSIVIQIRGLDTHPIGSGKPITLPFSGNLAEAGAIIDSGMSKTVEGRGGSFRESLIVVTDKNGRVTHYLEYNPADRVVRAATREDIEALRSGKMPKPSVVIRPSLEAPKPGASATGADPSIPAESGSGGISEGPGAAAASQFGPQKRIGGYNADVEARQAARGQTPTMSEARKEDPVTWEAAMETIEKDPLAPEKLVERIHEDPKRVLTDEEQQMLTWRRGDLENKMSLEAERAVDPNLSPEEQAIAQSNAELLEADLLRTEEANRKAGTAAGRSLRSRQMEMNDDYTFAGLMMRRRKITGEPVDAETRAKIQQQAKEIADLQQQVAKAEGTAAEAQQAADRTANLEAIIKEFPGSSQWGREVFETAQKTVNKWKASADEAHKSLRKRLGMMNVGVDPTIVLDVAKIFRGWVGEFGLNRIKASERIINEFGDKVRPYIDKAWAKAQELIAREKTPWKAKEAMAAGAKKKGEKTPEQVSAKAQAEADAGMELRGRTAYDAVRSAINEGAVGETAIMEKALEILKPSYPDLTLRTLDEKFTDYGNAKFPSKEAIKVQIAKQRQLRQMLLKIEDLKAKGEAKRSGFQRPKPDADVRARMKELQDAVERFSKDMPPTPEAIASREATAIRTKENAIERLDRQLRGVEAEIVKAKKEQSPQVEQLQAQLDAMRELKRELDDAGKPVKTPEERYNQRRLKDVERQLKEAEEKIRTGNFARPPKPVPPAKNKTVLDEEVKLQQAKEKVRKGEYDLKQSQRKIEQKIWDGVKAAGGASINTLSSYDFSGFRQGIGAILANTARTVIPVDIARNAAGKLRPTFTNPITAAKLNAVPAFRMFRAAFSEQKARSMEISRSKRKNFMSGAYKQMGLDIPSLDTSSHSKHEEMAHSILDEWAQLPYRTGNLAKTIATAPAKAHAKMVRGSNRAFNTLLVEMRMDLADFLLATNFKDRAPAAAELKTIGNLVNIATGRGNLNPAVASGAGKVFWAPNLAAARMKQLSLEPIWGGKTPFRGTGRARAVAAKEYARVIASGYALWLISRLFDEKDEEDPTSSDFGKIVRGNTRIDPWGGFQQFVVATERARTGKTKPVEGKAKQNDLGQVIGTFARNKLRPDWGALWNAYDIHMDKVKPGHPKTYGEAGLSMVTPLGLTSLVKVMRDRGMSEGAIIQALSTFGAGVNVYDGEEKESRRP